MDVRVDRELVVREDRLEVGVDRERSDRSDPLDCVDEEVGRDKCRVERECERLGGLNDRVDGNRSREARDQDFDGDLTDAGVGVRRQDEDFKNALADLGIGQGVDESIKGCAVDMGPEEGRVDRELLAEKCVDPELLVQPDLGVKEEAGGRLEG